jgi:hypothetical protein
MRVPQSQDTVNADEWVDGGLQSAPASEIQQSTKAGDLRFVEG